MQQDMFLRRTIALSPSIPILEGYLPTISTYSLSRAHKDPTILRDYTMQLTNVALTTLALALGASAVPVPNPLVRGSSDIVARSSFLDAVKKLLADAPNLANINPSLFGAREPTAGESGLNTRSPESLLETLLAFGQSTPDFDSSQLQTREPTAQESSVNARSPGGLFGEIVGPAPTFLRPGPDWDRSGSGARASERRLRDNADRAGEPCQRSRSRRPLRGHYRIISAPILQRRGPESVPSDSGAWNARASEGRLRVRTPSFQLGRCVTC
ncbi:hypothetical protein BV25DRAFT_1734993 [Artomyces pyxidatus]|uniref:Uncharacterized protein n=1 Tax=Artomyces pyxidatus TaxID=48021 RepID=A0ACB8SIV0_9AGAM|nr:hypothetical protein BV25DRAFT_1734993 [Artomyces pyxidatus]